jgi:hypothetical protein
MAAELALAAYNERLSETEIVRQATAIWLHAMGPENRAKVLEKIGYQPEDRSVRSSGPVAEANGSGPAEPADGPAKTVPADWDLDAAGSPAT